MELNDYQKQAMTTCMPSSENFSYMILNLVGEVGEFSSKVAKAIRKEQLKIKENELCGTGNYDAVETLSKEMMLEVSDIMWQVSGLCSVMGWTLEEVCQANLDKLASRKNRGVIDGNGDNR